MTTHKSKGLEADYVILMDLNSGVSDDPVMQMVLSAGDEFAFAEERRLFCVAMTRARYGTYLLAPSESASIFLEEDILSDDYKPWVKVQGELSKRHTCPICDGKTIRKKNGKYGDFWACSNFPLCDGKLLTCRQCSQGAIVPKETSSQCDNCHAVERSCPRCGTGTLVERKGRYGPFLACSNWNGGSGCNHTQNLSGEHSRPRQQVVRVR